jgi:hypothetical protein
MAEEKIYEIYTGICDTCGQLRVRYPFIEVMPGIFELAGANRMCECEKKELDRDMEKIIKECSPEVQEIFSKLRESRQ